MSRACCISGGVPAGRRRAFAEGPFIFDFLVVRAVGRNGVEGHNSAGIAGRRREREIRLGMGTFLIGWREYTLMSVPEPMGAVQEDWQAATLPNGSAARPAILG